MRANILCLTALTLVAACGEQASLPVDAGTGASPQLPAPNKTLLPTMNIAPIAPWQGTQAPTPATGLAVKAFALQAARTVRAGANAPWSMARFRPRALDRYSA